MVGGLSGHGAKTGSQQQVAWVIAIFGARARGEGSGDSEKSTLKYVMLYLAVTNLVNPKVAI